MMGAEKPGPRYRAQVISDEVPSGVGPPSTAMWPVGEEPGHSERGETCGHESPALSPSSSTKRCQLPKGHHAHLCGGTGWECLCDEACDRLEKAEAAIERVRALHRDEYGTCAECTDVRSVPYPCPTVTALDQPKEG